MVSSPVRAPRSVSTAFVVTVVPWTIIDVLGEEAGEVLPLQRGELAAGR